MTIIDAVAMRLHPEATDALAAWYADLGLERAWVFVIRWGTVLLVSAAGLLFARLADGWARAAARLRRTCMTR